MFVAHIQLPPNPCMKNSGRLEAGGVDYERGAVDQVSSADGLQSSYIPGRFKGKIPWFDMTFELWYQKSIWTYFVRRSIYRHRLDVN